MEPIRLTLCEDCEYCPAVLISNEDVRIGEEHNEVRLAHAQWNDLVHKIRAGELGTVGAADRIRTAL